MRTSPPPGACSARVSRSSARNRLSTSAPSRWTRQRRHTGRGVIHHGREAAQKRFWTKGDDRAGGARDGSVMGRSWAGEGRIASRRGRSGCNEMVVRSARSGDDSSSQNAQLRRRGQRDWSINYTPLTESIINEFCRC